ncbi:MAG: amidohydrolase [Planctomycetia bacterium]|nr:amidohydrolase [Planctomycetia bacterium]
MSHESRRDFVKRSALAAALGAGWVEPAKPQAVGKADLGPELAVVNAVVYTVDDKQPKAEAFAIRDGRFLAVGSTAEIRALATAKTKIIDAQGMTAVPGFIDAHTHPAYGGNRELLQLNCDKRSIADLKAAVKERAAKTPPGEWIFGFKYDDTKLQDGRPLLRSDLDEVAPNHPVRVEHRGGHTCVCNSAAFKLAGITKATPDPEGGKFGRDDKGELTGYAAELAVDLIAKAGKPPQSTPKQRQAAVKLMAELMTASGLTSVHDVDATKEDFIAYQDAQAAGELLFRVYALFHTPYFEVLRAAGIRHGYGNDWLRVGGVKLYVDGSASERTMRMSKPYVGRPNDYGILVTTQDKLNDQVLEAHKDGYQVGIHANGDVAIDMVLNAYELAQRALPRKDFRHKIEHCTLINDMLLKRIAAIGAIPTPFYTYVYYHGDKWSQYGEERTQSMFAHRSFLDHKIKVAGASDYVPGPFEPLMAIQSMVTRKDYRGRVWGANQKITVPEALRICTINGAHASYEEHVKGSITPGKFADFVLLADDPHKVDPDKIKDIPVVRTVVGGRTVYAKK